MSSNIAATEAHSSTNVRLNLGKPNWVGVGVPCSANVGQAFPSNCSISMRSVPQEGTDHFPSLDQIFPIGKFRVHTRACLARFHCTNAEHL